MTMEEMLLDRYGPLLSINQLSQLLDRSPEGLRISLRTPSDWSAKINASRLKIGRRVYFRTPQLAQLLADS